MLKPNQLTGFGSGVRYPPTLPAGALGMWVMPDYQVTNGNPVIRNRLSTTAVSSNLMRWPRRVFSSTQFWTAQNTVVTDNNATAPDGTMQASTIAGTGDWVFYWKTPNTTDGTFTVGCNIKRSGGSDQQFKIGHFGSPSHLSTTQTATSAWQRFSFTFTTSGGAGFTPCIKSIDGATAANLIICDFEVFFGSSDLGPETLAGHIYLGLSAVDDLPDVTPEGYLDTDSPSATTCRSAIQFGGTLSTGKNFTAMFLIKQTTTSFSSQAGFGTVMSKLDITQLLLQTAAGTGKLLVGLGGTSSGSGNGGLSNLGDAGWNVVTFRYDGTNVDWFLNGANIFRFAQASGGITTQTWNELVLGNYGSQALDPWLGQMAAAAFWPSALSDLNVANGSANLAISAGINLNPTRTITFEGDSISIGTFTSDGGFTYDYGPISDPRVIGGNYAVGGATVANNGGNSLIDRAAAVGSKTDLLATSWATAFPVLPHQPRPLFSVYIGSNDVNSNFPGYSGNQADWLNGLAGYLDARRAAGYRVVLCTLLSLGAPGAGVENTRESINVTLRTWVGVHCDYLVDFGDLGTTMGADGSCVTNASPAGAACYAPIPDNQHPNDAGTVLLDASYKAVMG